MKRSNTSTVIAGLLIFTALRCTDISAPADKGTISVYVHWQDSGLSGKKVEVIQTAEVQYTNERGVVEFVLPPGSYTVRVYDINRGGPCCGYVDYEVTLKTSAKETIDVVDCLPCV